MKKILFSMVFCFISFTLVHANTTSILLNGNANKLKPNIKVKSKQVSSFKKKTTFSTSYYVSPTGNDANSGTSTTTPFKTISKAASVAQTGDVCYIMRGVYRETVTPLNSGITFTKYNNDKVVIMGTDSVKNWQLYKNGIYKAYVPGAVTQLCVNNALGQEARYPNSDGNNLSTASWAPVSIDASGNATITGLSSSSNYWKGATFLGVVAKKWVSVNGVIDVSSGSTVHCVSRSSAWPTTYSANYIGSGKGFITNHINALDAVNEWHWQNDTLYYYPQDPSKLPQLNIQARKRINGFDLSSKSNINIVGINFLFASIKMENSSNCTIDGVNILYPTPYNKNFKYGFQRTTFSLWENKGVSVSGTNNIIKNSYIAHSWGDGISVGGTNNTVDNSLVEDCDWIGNDNAPVNVIGTGHNITHSTLRNAGRSSIVHRISPNTNITYNNISDAGYITSDLGITYTYGTNGHGAQIAYNWVHDNHAENLGEGIYLDNGDTLFVVHHNVIWKTVTAIRTNKPAVNHEIYNNTAWLSTNSMDAWGVAGTNIENQIVRNSLSDKPWSVFSTASNNLVTTAPLFTNVANYDFTLQSTSPAVGYGVAIPGITDGFVGTAPDAGAYEYGGTNWVPGSSVQPQTIQQILLGAVILPQTITFNPLSNVFNGSSDITLTATSDSGLPITYTTSDPNVATIIGSKMHIVRVGICTITASQAGDSNYSAATSVSQPLQVGNTTQLTPVADALVRDGSSANLNFGTMNTLVAKYDGVNTGYNREIYLKFDLNGIDSFDIATLRLNIAGAGTNVTSTTWQVYYVPTDTWTETGVTWNNKPASTTLLATINGKSSGWAEWDISSHALAELSGDKVVSLRIVTTLLSSPADVTFNSREATNTTLRPQLLLVKNQLPTVSVTSPVNNTLVSAPATFNITADAADADGTISKVEFFQGTSKLGEDLTAPYSFSWGNLPAGKYSITAVATDNSGGSTTSEIINIHVDATISTLADAYVRDGSYSTTNFGTANTLVAKYDGVNTSYNRETYLKFDLNGVNSFDIATMRLSIAGAGTNVASTTFQVYYVPTDSWTETGVNWSNKPASSTLLATINGQGSGWAQWDISSQAMAELSGDKTLSLRVVTTLLGAGADVTFRSKETTDPTLRPQLVLSQNSATAMNSSQSSNLADNNSTNKSVSAIDISNIKVDGLADASVQIYPNPVKDILNINIKGYSGPYEVAVFNIIGRMFLNKKMESSNAELDVSRLVTGVYLVKVTSAKGKTFKMMKIIKID